MHAPQAITRPVDWCSVFDRLTGFSKTEFSLLSYRNGIRIGLWLLVVFGGLIAVSLILWGMLSALGDVAGANVARVLVLVWGGALFFNLLGLVALLSRLQLELLERGPPDADQ